MGRENMSDWETGLCECFSDCNTCCSAYCCGCFDVAYHYSAAEDRHCGPMDGCGGVCCFLCCATFARNKIRQKYDIPGTFVGDFCCIWFCTCCAIAQQSRELRQRGVVHKYACCY